MVVVESDTLEGKFIKPRKTSPFVLTGGKSGVASASQTIKTTKKYAKLLVISDETKYKEIHADIKAK